MQSKDAIVQQLNEITSVMSSPPSKKAVVPDGSCRGLCSDQDEQLNAMRGFMEGLAKKQAVSAPIVVEEIAGEAAGEAAAEASAVEESDALNFLKISS